ncbi:MAG: TIGR03118 family protein [Terracidiphilus sp.]
MRPLRHPSASSGQAKSRALSQSHLCNQFYNQSNLVANTSGVAPVTDTALVNPRGLSRGSSSPWWAADNATGVATLYNGAGAKLSVTVTIPAATSGVTGSPTGTIYNGSPTDFLLAPGTPARFLFCTNDGLIVGWNNPTAGAITVVKTTDGSSYTGLTSATVNGRRYLYAANFTKGRVDVYNDAFQRVDWGEERFDDDWLPRNFVPFNVQTIGNDVVVTHALHEDGDQSETDGPGLGFVDIYSADGRMQVRLEHGDWLNAPWGVALAPLDFGAFSHDLLVAWFAGGGTTQSSGYIAAYDLATGRFKGLLEDASGNPIAINGVWAISPGNSSPNNYDSAGAPAGELYFAAGPNRGAGGLFGYLTPVAAELIEGSDQ